MQENKETYARLIHFFIQKPQLVSVILSEPSNVEVWEEIFFFFFGALPKDENESKPEYWRAGSTDSRWDTLLFKEKMGAMHALDILIKDIREGDVDIPSHKEAA